MQYEDVRMARACAHRDIELADIAVREAVSLIVGRLKAANVSGAHLEELKRELKGFNMRTWEWK